ncbi:MAG: hypothetical protein IJ936_07985 [Peptococcaceae bacterium]|nr:hypothetical protein [Peptococcaceae bacterium]
MKKNLLITALLVVAVAPAMAAPKPAPLTLKPLNTNKSITVGVEYTMFENAWADENAYGISLRYDKAFAPLKKDGDYWSWNLGGFWNTGEVDNGQGDPADFTVMGLRYGIDANFVVAPRTTVFAGPRVGYAIYEPDGGDDEDAITYGFAAGVRYQMENSTGVIECGFMHTWYAFQEEAMGTTESNSIFVGAGFAF